MNMLMDETVVTIAQTLANSCRLQDIQNNTYSVLCIGNYNTFLWQKFLYPKKKRRFSLNYFHNILEYMRERLERKILTVITLIF